VRLRAKVDIEQAAIVSALRHLGFSVLLLHRVGHGCPDLLVAGWVSEGARTDNILIELKTRNAKLTPDEVTFFEEWPGPKAVARSLDDVLRAFGREG